MIPSFTSENAKTVVGLGDRDVRRRDESCAAAERMALRADDDRRGAAVDRLEHLAHRVRVRDVLVERERDRRAHPLDIGAGAKARALAGEDDCSRAADVDEGLLKLADELRVERVAAFRARQRDPQHRAVTVDAKRAHGFSFRKEQGSVSLAARGTAAGFVPVNATRSARTRVVPSRTSRAGTAARSARTCGTVPAAQ